MKQEWIITVSGSNSDGAYVERVYGTPEQIREYIIKLIKGDIESNKEAFDSGTTDVSALTYTESYAFGYAVYADYHVDYQALVAEKLPTVYL